MLLIQLAVKVKSQNTCPATVGWREYYIFSTKETEEWQTSVVQQRNIIQTRVKLYILSTSEAHILRYRSTSRRKMYPEVHDRQNSTNGQSVPHGPTTVIL